MPRLGTILLVRSGAVSEESVTRALAVQGFAGGPARNPAASSGAPPSEDDIGKALSEQHGCPYVPLERPRLRAPEP